MKHSDEAVKLIAKWEGFRAKKYLCPAGLPTIGYGHVIGKNEKHLEDTELTKDEAWTLLEKDLVIYNKQVNSLCDELGTRLVQHQFDACVSFAYNCGIHNLRRSRIVEFAKTGDISEAVRKFNLYTKAKVKGIYVDLPGLVSRRKEESSLFMGV